MKRAFYALVLVLSFALALNSLAREVWIEDDPGIGEEEFLLPMAGGIGWQQLMGVNRDYPYYSWVFTPMLLLPIKAIESSVRAYMPISAELTDRTGTTYKHEPLLSDFTLRFSIMPEILMIPKTGVMFGYATNLAFPTSKNSQFQTKQFTWSNDVIVAKSLWAFDFMYVFRFTKGFHKFTTPELEPSGEVAIPDDVAAAAQAQQGLPVLQRSGILSIIGRANTSYQIMNMLGLSYTVTDELWLEFSFYTVNGRAYKVSDEKERGERDSWGSETALRYTPWEYLNFGIGWATEVPMLRPDSKGYYNPLVEANGLDDFTMIYFKINGTFGDKEVAKSLGALL
ncbi:MAG: hypothetical protein Kow0090_13420 [Myxococcota bacterium]